MYQYPGVKVTRINLVPLLPPGTLENFNPRRVLKALDREVTKTIRNKILQSTFSHRAKMALAQGFKIRHDASSITVVAVHPGFRPLLEGRRNRQMKWLVKAQAPIPIITDTGELIFRSATPRSMENGSWYHPQRKATTVLQKARVEARKVIMARMAKVMRRQVRLALARAKR